MLTIRELVDFLALLKSGNVMDGLEQGLPENEVSTIYSSITEKKDPARTEWLDAHFKVVNDILHINYYHQSVNGQLHPQKSEPLEKCLMSEDLNVDSLGIYVDLFSTNSQGLPTQKSRRQDFFYFPPTDDFTPWFGAFSKDAILYCGVLIPTDSNTTISVRAPHA